MSETKSYDNVDGIREYLGDLAGLHRLIADRRAAYYERKEYLESFIILGRWATDSCGNFGRCAIGIRSIRTSDGSWIAEDLPAVVNMSGLRVLKSMMISTSFDGLPPRADSVCHECGTGWTIESAHDFVHSRYAKTSADPVLYEHSYCHKLSAERDATQEFRDYLVKAGLGQALLTMIPNEYWKEDTAEPWCLARTPFGTLKMGWRKRVLHIDWAAVLKDRLARIGKLDIDPRYAERQAIMTAWDGKTLFPNEDVTRWESGIHAWGAEKAVEYLKVLREKVLCKPEAAKGW